jgi:hypothetical protein
MTPEQTLDWLAEQHKSQCNDDRPVQEWIRSMKSMLPAPVQEPVAWWIPKHKAPDMVSKVRWSDECEPLYTTPPAAQRQWVVFPTMLRKMWSGGEVQKWLDENVNKENT